MGMALIKTNCIVAEHLGQAGKILPFRSLMSLIGGVKDSVGSASWNLFLSLQYVAVVHNQRIAVRHPGACSVLLAFR